MNELINKQEKKNSNTIWYFALSLVVLLWGLSPINSKFLYDYCSPTMYTLSMAVITFISLLIINAKKLNLLNSSYFKIAIPTGLALGLAQVLQKIGLQYTTPSKYAFLENLSCVIIPVLTYIYVRKKPTIFKILGALLCLVGSFILSGLFSSHANFSVGLGEALCALSGIFYGVNIATTGTYAKKLDSSLYVMIQMAIYSILSIASSFILCLPVFGGNMSNVFVFSFNPLFLLWLIAGTLLTSTFCWILRTKCMQHIDATVIGVVSPCSAVITGIVSVAIGMESFSFSLLFGGLFAVVAVIISAIEPKKKKVENA